MGQAILGDIGAKTNQGKIRTNLGKIGTNRDILAKCPDFQWIKPDILSKFGANWPFAPNSDQLTIAWIWKISFNYGMARRSSSSINYPSQYNHSLTDTHQSTPVNSRHSSKTPLLIKKFDKLWYINCYVESLFWPNIFDHLFWFEFLCWSLCFKK